jgi:hypothetical protein
MPTLAEIRQQYPEYNDLSDAKLADSFYTKYYTDMPREDFYKKIGYSEKIETPKDVWDKPDTFSLIGMVKGAYEGIKAPGDALAGKFSYPTATPGVQTEEEAFLQDIGRKQEMAAGGKLAATTLLGQAPGGIFAAPEGAIGMGFAKPGTIAGKPITTPVTKATDPVNTIPDSVIDAATKIEVPIPRFIAGSRMDQGLGAGLQNIPGAGDKIAEAANKTVSALGTAADKVAQGYGTGSPAVGGSFAKDALTEWLTEGSKKAATRVYDTVDNLVNPEVATPLSATLKTAQEIWSRREAAKIPGKSAAVETILEAATAPGGMPYKGLKDLRSFVGEMTPEELVSQGLKASEVKQLYGALSTDLRNNIAAAGGGKAVAAFDKANRIYESISTVRKDLSRVLGAKGDAAPEAVFTKLISMAGSKSTADIARLSQARKVMGGEAWNEVASAAVSKMGRDPTGDFSIQRFLTAYGNLSPAGRLKLFQSSGRDDLGQSLENIYTVSKAIEDKLKQFANPSGTARSLVSTGMVVDIIRSPIKVLSTLIGGNRLAKVLSEPVTARATADWARAYKEAITAPSANADAKTRRAAEKLADLIVSRGGGNKTEILAALQITSQLTNQ